MPDNPNYYRRSHWSFLLSVFGDITAVSHFVQLFMMAFRLFCGPYFVPLYWLKFLLTFELYEEHGFSSQMKSRTSDRNRWSVPEVTRKHPIDERCMIITIDHESGVQSHVLLLGVHVLMQPALTLFHKMIWLTNETIYLGFMTETYIFTRGVWTVHPKFSQNVSHGISFVPNRFYQEQCGWIWSSREPYQRC